jgi:hypothetical protein
MVKTMSLKREIARWVGLHPGKADLSYIDLIACADQHHPGGARNVLLRFGEGMAAELDAIAHGKSKAPNNYASVLPILLRPLSECVSGTPIIAKGAQKILSDWDKARKKCDDNPLYIVEQPTVSVTNVSIPPLQPGQSVTVHGPSLPAEGNSQRSLMKYDPATCSIDPYPSHAGQYREHHGKVAWLFNPWTGFARDPRDIGSDVRGAGIKEPSNAR